jgi:hypothetical protein
VEAAGDRAAFCITYASVVCPVCTLSRLLCACGCPCVMRGSVRVGNTLRMCHCCFSFLHLALGLCLLWHMQAPQSGLLSIVLSLLSTQFPMSITIESVV